VIPIFHWTRKTPDPKKVVPGKGGLQRKKGPLPEREARFAKTPRCPGEKKIEPPKKGRKGGGPFSLPARKIVPKKKHVITP